MFTSMVNTNREERGGGGDERDERTREEKRAGLAANEFSFFEFMQPFYEDAGYSCITTPFQFFVGIGLDGADSREAVAE